MNMQQTAQCKNDTPAPPRARREKKGSHTEKKVKAWLQQHSALQAPAYRLTLTHPEKKSFNVGKRKDGSERFFAADDIVDRLPLLAAKNSQGYNVYVTPICGHEHYIVLDDTTSAALNALKAHGFMPCLIQESSPENLQAVFRAARHPRFEYEQSAANAVVCRLNRKFGDPAFSGVIHPFRLAGFANRKDKYAKNGRYPFVRVHQVQNIQCHRLNNVLETERRAAQDTKQDQRGCRKRCNQDPVRTSLRDNHGELIESFLDQRDQVLKRIEKKGLRRDESRIDFNVAEIMLGQGYEARQVVSAIKQASPRVSERHNNVNDYAQRTVSRAQNRLSFFRAARRRRGCVD